MDGVIAPRSRHAGAQTQRAWFIRQGRRRFLGGVSPVMRKIQAVLERIACSHAVTLIDGGVECR